MEITATGDDDVRKLMLRRHKPTPPDNAALRMLPWGEYAGSSLMEGGGKKAMSGGQLLGSFGIVAFLISVPALLIIWFSGDFPRSFAIASSSYLGPAAAISALSIPLGFWWHARLRREPRGTPPDVLGALFPHAHLMEADAVQLAVFAFAHARFCRVVVVAQNRFDRPIDLVMDFDGDFASRLAVQIPAAGVVMSWRDSNVASAGGVDRTVFGVTAKPAGRLARTVRRNLIGRNAIQHVGVGALIVSSPLKAAIHLASETLRGAAARPYRGGHVIFADLAGVLPTPQARASAHAPPAPDLSDDHWISEIMWTAADPGDVTRWAEQLARLIGDTPVAYVFPFTEYPADAARSLHRG